MAMNRLKEMRLKHHLHQYDFEKLGFSATTYRKSEQGVRQVSWEEWRKLAVKVYSKEEFDEYKFCPKCSHKTLTKKKEKD